MDTLFRAWLWDGACWMEATTLSISDRGFRYGASVFETVFVKAGSPLFWQAHIRQFQEARSALAEVAIPEIPEFPRKDQLQMLARHWVDGRDALLRLVATEGEGRMGEGCSTQTLIAYAEILSESGSGEAPLHVTVFPEAFTPVLHGHKTGSYLFHLRARRHAIAQGVDESILVRENREWVSASMANLFLISNGEIQTPPLASGARKGIVRSWIGQEVGIREKVLFKEDFLSAEGIFITNSRMGIREVRRIDGDEVSVSQKTIDLCRRWMEVLHQAG